MLRTKKQPTQEVNAGSMADIAFLLLIFFLVTTTILQDKGLSVLLPPHEQDARPLYTRNLCKVLINANNELLVNDERIALSQLRSTLKTFINNEGKDIHKSVSPQEAVVALRTDRGTGYQMYIRVLDETKAAYHELRAEALGITLEEYLAFDANQASKAALARYEAVKKQIPLRISESKPTVVKEL